MQTQTINPDTKVYVGTIAYLEEGTEIPLGWEKCDGHETTLIANGKKEKVFLPVLVNRNGYRPGGEIPVKMIPIIKTTDEFDLVELD